VPAAGIAGISVVLLGDFNPAILHPAWLAAHDLLRQEEADAAEIQLVSRDLTVFSTEWVELAASPDRFSVASASAPSYNLLRDLTIGVFRLLPHTPIRALGINRNQHFPVEDVGAWNAFGDRLAPKDIWSNILQSPGMRSLIMQGKRPDEYVGHVLVQVEPSLRLEHGIYIGLNDHVQLDQMDMTTTSEMADVLEDTWEPAKARAEVITTQLLETL